MRIIYTFPDYSVSFSEYEKYLPLISPERLEKITRMKNDAGKKESLFTELLIRGAVIDELKISDSEIKFGYNEHGKPYLMNNPNYHFSVSHSVDCIVFTSAAFPVGIDVEKISVPNFKIAKRFFTENENNYINASEDKNTAFYKIWTAKEAYIKMLGTGFATPISSFDVLNNSLPYEFAAEIINSNIITVCAEKIDRIELIYKNFVEF